MREARTPRDHSRDERIERSSDRGDFASELAAAREAARSAPPARTPEKPEKGDELENAGEVSAASEARHPSAAGPSRDMDALDPLLRAAVERVIARMRAEHGHEVTVVEGVRTPERQAQLFAQGRTAPGAVVTWTMNSRHLHGRAADLMVDGGWTDMEGYARLQRIAGEEGLSVLGMKDPGHVELRPEGMRHPAEAHSQHGLTSRSTEQRAGTQHGMRVARDASFQLATQARVAEVASVAQVAEPAGVARPANVAQVAAVAVPGSSAAPSFQRGSGGSAGSSSQHGSPQQDAASVMVEQLTATDSDSAFAPAPDGRFSARVMELRAAESTSGTDQLGRIAQVEQVRETVGARAPSSLTLRLDNGMGGEDRVRLDLRGTTVGATMDVGDARLAERIGSTIHELRQALERRGLTAERLQVRAPGAEVVEAARVSAVQLDREAARFSNAQHTPQRQDEQPQWQQRDAHAQRDSQDFDGHRQRHDSRREAPVFTTEGL